MKSYEVGICFYVEAEDEDHAIEQFEELLLDSGNTLNVLREVLV